MMTHIAVVDFELSGIAGREIMRVDLSGKPWASIFLVGVEFGLYLAAERTHARDFGEESSLRIRGMTCHAIAEVADANE